MVLLLAPFVGLVNSGFVFNLINSIQCLELELNQIKAGLTETNQQITPIINYQTNYSAIDFRFQFSIHPIQLKTFN